MTDQTSGKKGVRMAVALAKQKKAIPQAEHRQGGTYQTRGKAYDARPPDVFPRPAMNL